MKKFLCVLLCCFVFVPSYGMKQMILQTRNVLFKPNILSVQKRFLKNDKEKLFWKNSKSLYGSKVDLKRDGDVILEIYMFLPCGICKKLFGSSVTWFSKISPVAHKACFDSIKKTEKQVYKDILKFLDPNTATKNDIARVHMEFIYRVECKIEQLTSEKLTILEYRHIYGEKALQKLFEDTFIVYKELVTMEKTLGIIDDF